MSDDSIDPNLSRLLREGSAPTSAPSEARARLEARLGAAIPGFVPPAPPSPGSPSAPTSPASAIATGTKLGLIGAGLALGIAIGSAVTYAMMPSPASRIVYVDRVAPPPSAVPEPTASIPFASLPEIAPSASAAPSAAVNTITVERRLIDTARTAYSRGEREVSLKELAVHASRFPNGVLAEEREALAIRVLVDLGKKEEAQDRGRRFLAKYPKSLMLPAVQAALESIL